MCVGQQKQKREDLAEGAKSSVAPEGNTHHGYMAFWPPSGNLDANPHGRARQWEFSGDPLLLCDSLSSVFTPPGRDLRARTEQSEPQSKQRFLGTAQPMRRHAKCRAVSCARQMQPTYVQGWARTSLMMSLLVWTIEKWSAKCGEL